MPTPTDAETVAVDSTGSTTEFGTAADLGRPASATGAGSRWRRFGLGRSIALGDPVTLYVAMLAVASAVAAVLIHHLVFPVLSINNDEGIYLLHAQTLAEGRLFPQAPAPAGSFTPWLAVVDGDHYVLKYTPFVPALFAASLLLTGGVAAALALVAAAAVVVTYLLGREVFADRRVAVVAATLLATSPLVLVQSALLVGYLPVFVLTEVAALGLFRALRTGHRPPLVVAGLALGCAAAVRPYDVVLFSLPMVVWAAVIAQGRRWWLARWAAAGTAVPAAVLLASDAAATGSPFRLPFALLESSDTVGYGVRKLYPTDIPRQFGFTDGLSGVGSHLWLLGAWACAGVLLLGCAIAALARRRVPGPGAALGAGAVVLLVGYLFFWGVWNAAELWGGISYLGPFYVLPVVLPLVLLGARGLVDLAATRPRIAGGSVALAAGLSVFVLVQAVQTNLVFSRHDEDLAALIDSAAAETETEAADAAGPGAAATGGPEVRGGAEQPLVFVGLDPPFLGRPATLLANSPELHGDVLFAVSRGGADFAVAADDPSRPVYLLRVPVPFNETPQTRSTAAMDRLDLVSGPRVDVDVDLDPAPEDATAARLVVTANGRRSSYRVDPGDGAHLTLAVTPDGVRVGGLAGPTSVSFVPTPRDRSVLLAYYATLGSTGKEHYVDRYVLPVRRVSAPGDGNGPDQEPDREPNRVEVMVPASEVGRVGDGRQPSFHLAAN